MISFRSQTVSAVCAVTLLSGCVSLGGGKAPKALIALTPEKVAPAGDLAQGKLATALVLLDPETDRRLAVLRVPVQVSETDIAYLKDANWVERPARQFRRLLAEAIRAKGGRLVLEAGDEAPRGAPVLSGRLLDMGYDARNRTVVVRYDALRSLADGTVASRRFEAVIKGVAPDVRSVAPALNRAANTVATQVAEWL